MKDVRIEERLYDAARGVTVVRISYELDGERLMTKGCAFCSPEDQAVKSKAEGTFHAIRHAAMSGGETDYERAELFTQALLAAVRGGYFNFNNPVTEAAVAPGLHPAYRALICGPVGPSSFVLAPRVIG